MQYYHFPCGCAFPVLEAYADSKLMPKLDFHIDDISFDCQETWKILSRGLTKGIFQLESQLGKQWAKRLKPEHIEHLGALGALLRPGCLRAISEKDGCSMTELYCRRKNGESEVEYFHPSIEHILRPTYGVMTYQEQAMQIAQVVAGFNLQEADELRKAIGKKLPEEMAKVKVKFLDGVARCQIVTKEQGDELFGWIEKSQRYSFNKSHSISYGINGYISAYLKAHFPVQFYTAWLYYAKDNSDPQTEIRDLISDAKLLDVEVLPPNLLDLEPHFSTDGVVVKFGLSDIKGIGEAQIEKVKEAVEKVEAQLGKRIQEMSWIEILINFTPLVSSAVVERLIAVGAMRQFGSNRTLMKEEYTKWNSLTEKEQNWIRERCRQFNNLPLTSILKAAAPRKTEGGATATDKRKQVLLDAVKMLENPATPLEDTSNWIAWTEENLLGISLTCNRVDSCDTSMVNSTCKEFLAGKTGYMVFGVEVQSAREVKVRNGKQAGKPMAFLTVSDRSCAVDMTAFPEAWGEFGYMLTPGNTVAIQAERDRKQDSLIVKKVYQI